MNESAHPSPETLAAFVDGRLAGEERRALVTHLDACPDCYEVFAETVRFQGEEQPRGHVLRSPRLGARRWLGWAAAAAAVVAVAIAGASALPVLRMEPGREGMASLPGEGELALSSRAVVAAIQVPEGAALSGAPWQEWPGAGLGFASAGLDEETAAFRAGVRLVDLRAALVAREADAAARALGELAETLESAGLAEDLEEPLEDARGAAERGRFEPLETAAAELETGAEELLDPFHLAFGKWAEAGRLGAALGDRGFFQSPEFVGFREELEARELPETIVEALQEIDEWTREEIGPQEEMEKLGEAFRRLIATSGGAS